VQSTLFAEVIAAILSMEFAFSKGWSKVWLECDTVLVVQAFSKTFLVSHSIRNR